MSRTICLRVCIVQLLLFSVLLSLYFFSHMFWISRDVGRPIFMAIVPVIVALSPFGVISLFLTFGYKLLSGSKEEKEILAGSPVLFFVWREVRSNMSEGK
jgi:hypothetical protein